MTRSRARPAGQSVTGRKRSASYRQRTSSTHKDPLKAGATAKRTGRKPQKELKFHDFLQQKLRNVAQKWPPIYMFKNDRKIWATVQRISATELHVIADTGEEFIVENSKATSGRRVMYRCEYCGLLWFERSWVQCKNGKWRKTSDIALDHIEPVVDPYTGHVSWDKHIDRLFHGAMQLLCKPCHNLKSDLENQIRRAQ